MISPHTAPNWKGIKLQAEIRFKLHFIQVWRWPLVASLWCIERVGREVE